MKILIYSDGGARGNPGPAGIGAVIMNRDKKVLHRIKQYIGETTNNQAEYRALLEGLKIALTFSPQEIECYLDSELVVNQLKGIYKVKDPGLKILHGQILELLFMRLVTFTHIPREQNTLADKLVNEALNEALWGSR